MTTGTVKRFSGLFTFVGAFWMLLSASALATPVVTMLGDSLTAGYGLPPAHALPKQIENVLREQGVETVFINAGVSGDTTAGGLARFEWSVPDNTDLLIIELGGNDGLRGLPVPEAMFNLDEIIKKAHAQNMPVLLLGIRALRNYGQKYAQDFDLMYELLAKKHNVPLYPHMLRGVAMNPGLNQKDMLHPNAKGARIIAENLAPHVVDALKNAGHLSDTQ